MLDSTIQAQLKAYLERLQQPIELVASLDESAGAAEMRELLDDIAPLSDKLSVRFDGTDARKPSFQITRAGQDMGVRFAAVPMGHEFTSLVLALLQAVGIRRRSSPRSSNRSARSKATSSSRPG